MKQRAKISELPHSMAENAYFARKTAKEYPELVDLDDDMLPWVYEQETGLWLSFDGNYSSISPEKKRKYKIDQEKKRIENEEKAEKNAHEKYEHVLYWSKIREEVLERDKFTCQLCGKHAETKLHIHHILKVKDGGEDYLDNLITVCPSCHKHADINLYDMEWK